MTLFEYLAIAFGLHFVLLMLALLLDVLLAQGRGLDLRARRRHGRPHAARLARALRGAEPIDRRPGRPFLTARWENLVILNYDCPRSLLQPLVPTGTESTTGTAGTW